MDGITGILVQGGFGAAALLMLWKYIQQTGENERKREENAQTFLHAITAELKENTQATNNLTAKFGEFSGRISREENQAQPRGRRQAPQ